MNLRKVKIFLSHPTMMIMLMVHGYGLTLLLNVLNFRHVMAFGLGGLIYIVQEYSTHRYIFHCAAPNNTMLFRLLYRRDYGHHDQATNAQLLFTPLWYALPLTFLNVAVLILLGVSHQVALIMIFGWGVGAYLVCEWLHLNCHIVGVRKSSFIQRIAKRHSLHHSMDYMKWFTVSPGGALLDALFKTNKSEGRRSNVQTLGLPCDDPRFLDAREYFGTNKGLLLK